ncbi:MAG: hypothetical protein BroJett029_12410 [Alphaproteobacteria bacterium]|nr:MAG: hypothetical protein BroJett029_12410 [Alphaproteobacteria bacterium]
MRQIVLFQTFATIVLGLAMLLFLFRIDSKLDELFSLELANAQALDETPEIKALLEEIAAAAAIVAERSSSAPVAAQPVPSATQ